MTSGLAKAIIGRRPRVLYFAPSECLPANTGARIRNYHLARALAEDARVTYLSFCAEDGVDPAMENLDWCERVVSVQRPSGYSVRNILRGVIGRWPITVLNYTTREMADTLARLLDEMDFDAVQMESLLLMAYLPIIRNARSKPIVVADWHNIDSEVFERYSKRAPSMAKSVYASWTAARVRSLEKRSLQQFDAHLTVSERDRSRLLQINPSANVFLASNGVDSDFYSEEACERALRNSFDDSLIAAVWPPKRNRILFAGSMDYFANVDAAIWFAQAIWPELHRRYHDVIFTIAGRNPAPEVRALSGIPGIEVTGTVDDLRPYYREALAAVVPLKIGGGSRLKILEAMAAGVPVVSTKLGAEGIEVSNGENIIIADTADELSRSLDDLVQDTELWRNLTGSALWLVRRQYDWSAIGKALGDTYASVLDTRCTATPRFAEVGA